MISSRRAASVFVLAILVLSVVGCGNGPGFTAPTNKYWFENRFYDFLDIFILEGGVTMENPKTGMVPPSFGFFVEATPIFTLGAITHNGYSAGLELRGTGAYFENRARLGIGPFQGWKINQKGRVNMFKTPGYVWQERMKDEMSWEGSLPKNLIREDTEWHWGAFSNMRGWQYWEVCSFEVAFSEPFLLHSGGTVRFGFELSEVLDFILGIVCIDFKRDDLRAHDTDRVPAIVMPPKEE